MYVKATTFGPHRVNDCALFASTLLEVEILRLHKKALAGRILEETHNLQVD